MYIQKREVNSQSYFYLVKSIRTKEGFRKIKRYLGKKLPKNLTKIKKEIEQEAKELKKDHHHLKKKELEKVEQIKHRFKKKYKKVDKLIKEKIDRDFLIRLTYHTNKLEGNTISLRGTQLLLDEDITPGNKSMRELLEHKNMEQCFHHLIKEKQDLSLPLILKLHKILMKDILKKDVGILRKHDIKIVGAEWLPPNHKNLTYYMTEFIKDYKKKKRSIHPIELAAIMHVRFVKIHPFLDGNGRIARLIMNYILMKNDFPPIYINAKNKKQYCNLLDKAHVKGNEDRFIRFVIKSFIEQYS